MAVQPGWQQPSQRGQNCAVGPVQPRPGDLAAQDRDLMAEDQDLGVLGRLAAAQQVQPAKTRIMMRYRRRIGTDRDLAPPQSSSQTAGHDL
jgi:hypothetical protein